VELNGAAVEAQAGPSPRSTEEWLDSDEVLGAMQLPTILTLSTVGTGLSTQCPTDSVNECLLPVTTVTVCDNDDDSTDADDVCNDPLLLTDEAVQLLLGDTNITTSAGYTVTMSNTQEEDDNNNNKQQQHLQNLNSH